MTKPQGDPTTDFVAGSVPAGKYLVNPYEDWARGEGVPVHTGRTIDLMTVETKPWPRFGCNGAIAHVEGRCDFLTVFVHELVPGQAASPQRHVYDELCVALSGEGETEIETSAGKHVVAWGPGTLIAPSTNALYRHRSTGTSTTRLACFNDMRYLLSLFRNERFVFENPLVAAVGSASEVHQTVLRQDYAERADALPNTSSVVLGSGTIGADIIIAPIVHTPARRQMQGAHLLGLEGEGLTRSWREGAEATASQTRWRHGMLVGLPGMHFHRHVSAGAGPARALDVQLGSALFPMTRSRRHHYGDKSVYASGSAEIE